MRGEHKSRMHFLFWQPSWIFLLQQTKAKGILGFSFYFKFGINSSPCFFSVTWHTPSWFLPCMLLTRVAHSKALCCGVWKQRFFICQSIGGLCQTNQDNPMMTRFLREKMTLKTTLLVWEPMVTSNVLVSCVIGPNERL